MLAVCLKLICFVCIVSFSGVESCRLGKAAGETGKNQVKLLRFEEKATVAITAGRQETWLQFPVNSIGRFLFVRGTTQPFTNVHMMPHWGFFLHSLLFSTFSLSSAHTKKDKKRQITFPDPLQIKLDCWGCIIALAVYGSANPITECQGSLHPSAR